jgi:glycosyltransferase involved in cell wall biosynthesis
MSLARKLGVSDGVIFAGHVPRVSDYYYAADAFVFPTRHEPFGMVITEAMAAGLPVITSADAGAAELVKDGRDAMLLEDPRNVDELKDRIKTMLASGGLRKRISRNGLKVAKSTDWEITAKKFEKVYREVL